MGPPFDRQAPSIGASGGSFGRWNVEAEHGGSRGPFDWYLAFNALDEDGWRAESPSKLRQLFTKVGWESGGTAVADVGAEVAARHDEVGTLMNSFSRIRRST